MGTYSPQSERTHYLTLQEAVAEGFGAYSTLRLWIAQGKLPAYKTGKRVKVLREDLEALAVPVRANPVDHAIDKLVDAAPSFTAEQTRRLRDLLGGCSAMTIKNHLGTPTEESSEAISPVSTTSLVNDTMLLTANQLIFQEVANFLGMKDQSEYWAGDVERYLLNRINTCLLSENKKHDLRGELAHRPLKTLPPSVIATRILNHELRHTGLIGKSKATAELVTYQATGPDKGLYAPTEPHIRQLARQYNYTIPSKDLGAVVECVRDSVSLLAESEDGDVAAFANGLFDLRSKELRPFSPEVVLRSKASTDFNGNATTCPVINGWSVDEWIRELANDDPEIEQPVRESIEEQGLRPDKYDVFLCHAWDDRRETAKELHDALVRAGVSVWFSENEVLLGSNLMREIDKGLSKSRAGVVLVTKSFIKRIKAEGVANKELSALLARDRLVPIVHGVTYDDLREESPLLASRSGFDTADDTMEEIATKISELVSTDAFSD